MRRAAFCSASFASSAVACFLFAAVPLHAQFTSYSKNPKNILEGNWQSCRQADGSYTERVYDHVVNGVPRQLLQITRPDSVIDVGAYAIDSLSPTEYTASSPSPATCAAPRPWALWNALTVGIDGYSRRGGTLVVMQIDSVPGGQVMSGHFTFTAQRRDLYTDPLGALSITGSFVAPLVHSTDICR